MGAWRRNFLVQDCELDRQKMVFDSKIVQREEDWAHGQEQIQLLDEEIERKELAFGWGQLVKKHDSKILEEVGEKRVLRKKLINRIISCCKKLGRKLYDKNWEITSGSWWIWITEPCFFTFSWIS